MQTDEHDIAAISQALKDYYLKGIYEGNVELLRKIYHTDTLLFGDVKGQPYAKTLEEYFEGVAQRQSPKNSGKPFSGTVFSVEVVNTTAVAQLQVKMYDFNYHDFLSFHKINGTWLIVNKMLSDVSE